MTIDEAIRILKLSIENSRNHVRFCFDNKGITALDMAIKALEQEPCEDVISRQAVLTEIFKKPAWHNSDGSYYYADDIRDAVNSVKPQEPTTVLYSGDGYADGYMVYDMAECPNCGRKFEYGDETWNCKFCPDCGQALNWESEEI